MEEAAFMEEALALARIGMGYTSPNPSVGCVIVKDGEIVGKGYHHRAGTPHAEVWALKEAGARAKGATVYVTLEPCAHYGRTPPCARALVKAGVAKVVCAMLDPNPLVAGKGAAILRNAGIPVIVGLLSKEAIKVNEVFIKNMLTQKPFIAVKLAQSLDGSTATRTGKSKWITNEWARKRGYYLRSLYDAILVGIKTVEADNPLLTSRTTREGHTAPRQPARVILDSAGRTELNSLLVTDKQAKTIVVTTAHCPAPKRQALEEAGVTVLLTPLDKTDRVDLQVMLTMLYDMGIHSILIEGGSTVQGAFFDDNLVDKIYAFIGDKVIGGADAKPSVGGLGADELSESMELIYDTAEIHDNNIFIEAYNKNREGAYVHWNH
ncbi:bifunctional diaminohydroxyphosphoribosylaminopyrimidine deaminase/5-amino-6-(5-phosphoribosylamino)uracil reductase RibD [Colibacter massiliensis]|uniref:bifunctional diaminohydroxyphosphoribosylaminopyrimidine deaminase/5-amino-6-(5-phosphoribosylamino)uracil reductase RibD n=1 Tax=Colibacter massiliensis TaxID=1852379 RepID=UPI002354D8EE|nr:bifunctional diaminohydroxyphosphoribosylaminopyrimidine deaminase/5-amino-6-(5-phosphoribosylamino)uracil reductase RibD [Colibacter massiliensis]